MRANNLLQVTRFGRHYLTVLPPSPKTFSSHPAADTNESVVNWQKNRFIVEKGDRDVSFIIVVVDLVWVV